MVGRKEVHVRCITVGVVMSRQADSGIWWYYTADTTQKNRRSHERPTVRRSRWRPHPAARRNLQSPPLRRPTNRKPRLPPSLRRTLRRPKGTRRMVRPHVYSIFGALVNGPGPESENLVAS